MTGPTTAPTALSAVTLNGPLHGLDLAAKIGSPAEARALYAAAGSKFIGRYISRVSPENTRADLDPEELNALITAGFCVMPLQHYAGANFGYSAQLGEIYGAAAARIGRWLALPAGSRIYVDVESPAAHSDPVGFTEAWVRSLKEGSDGQYLGGLYTGAPGLSAAQAEQLAEQGYTSAEIRGCGAPAGQEQLTQYQGNSTLTGGGYRWSIDRDLLVSGDRVGGFVGLS